MPQYSQSTNSSSSYVNPWAFAPTTNFTDVLGSLQTSQQPYLNQAIGALQGQATGLQNLGNVYTQNNQNTLGNLLSSYNTANQNINQNNQLANQYLGQQATSATGGVTSAAAARGFSGGDPFIQGQVTSAVNPINQQITATNTATGQNLANTANQYQSAVTDTNNQLNTQLAQIQNQMQAINSNIAQTTMQYQQGLISEAQALMQQQQNYADKQQTAALAWDKMQQQQPYYNARTAYYASKAGASSPAMADLNSALKTANSFTTSRTPKGSTTAQKVTDYQTGQDYLYRTLKAHEQAGDWDPNTLAQGWAAWQSMAADSNANFGTNIQLQPPTPEQQQQQAFQQFQSQFPINVNNYQPNFLENILRRL